MPLLTKLSKFKSLSPVIIIGSAVIITIKLLTTQTPSQEEIITVSVKEDILNTEYEDQLDIPEPPKPESQQEEDKPQEREDSTKEPEEENEDQDQEQEAEGDTVQEEEPEPESSPEETTPPPKPATKLTWAKGNLPNLLKKLVSSIQEK